MFTDIVVQELVSPNEPQSKQVIHCYFHLQHLSNVHGKCNAELMMSECYLADVFGCANLGKELIKAGHERIKKIINLSKLRQDNIYLE